MENASKALIIAGAILLAILLISLGIFVFDSVNLEEYLNGMDKQSAEIFNGQFTEYSGTITGDQAVTLANKAFSSAAGEEGVAVTVTLGGNEITSVGPIDKNQNYKVDYTYTQGVITGISLTVPTP